MKKSTIGSALRRAVEEKTRLGAPSRIVSEESIGTKGRFGNVRRLKISTPALSGPKKTVTRFVTMGGKSVSVLAHDPWKDKIVLVQELAAGLLARDIQTIFRGLIAGGMNKGESPEKAGLRELRQETGLQGLSTKLIQRLLPVAPTVSTHQACMIYVQVDLTSWTGKDKPRKDGDGIVIPRVVSTAEFLELCATGECASQNMAVAAMWYKQKAMWLSLAKPPVRAAR
ncbi:MAG: NUDIX domain-containing protein [Alphaproteobacteria bacterium]|nr:MAG: NUDIX domain-containing protein [Alphaproteobacteria bacterium]